MSTHSDGSGRNKERTKQKLVEATIALVREEGFDRVGINAIAQRAGVSKILIYRYFDSLSGLFEAVADSIDPLQATRFHELMKNMGETSTVGAIMKQMILELHKGLKDDELTKQLLIWELSNQNEMTEALASARERMGLELTKRLTAQLDRGAGATEVDLNAILALVTAGVFYLTLRSDSVQDFNGIDIRSEGGWDRMAEALSRLFQN